MRSLAGRIFLRTPKFRVEKQVIFGRRVLSAAAESSASGGVILLLYALVAVGVAISLRNYTTAFFMLLYAWLGLSLGIELEQAWSVRQIVRLQLFPSPVRFRKTTFRLNERGSVVIALC